jgi:hypothetical protein
VFEGVEESGKGWAGRGAACGVKLQGQVSRGGGLGWAPGLGVDQFQFGTSFDQTKLSECPAKAKSSPAAAAGVEGRVSRRVSGFLVLLDTVYDVLLPINPPPQALPGLRRLRPAFNPPRPPRGGPVASRRLASQPTPSPRLPVAQEAMLATRSRWIALFGLPPGGDVTCILAF